MHFSLLLITKDIDADMVDDSNDIEGMMEPFCEAWEEWEPYTESYYDEDGELCWHNPNAKWDWYEIGGRWDGLLDGRNVTTIDRHTTIDPMRVYSVLTPDGEWYDCKTFDIELTSEEHPYGTFVEDPTFKSCFKERFIDPYHGYTAVVVDYHI